MATCKDCLHLEDCETESKTNPHKREIMWIMTFWENAHRRCAKFMEKIKTEREQK